MIKLQVYITLVYLVTEYCKNSIMWQPKPDVHGGTAAGKHASQIVRCCSLLFLCRSSMEPPSIEALAAAASGQRAAEQKVYIGALLVSRIALTLSFLPAHWEEPGERGDRDVSGERLSRTESSAISASVELIASPHAFLHVYSQR